MATKKVSRDAGTGRFVTEGYAKSILKLQLLKQSSLVNHLKNDLNVNPSFG